MSNQHPTTDRGTLLSLQAVRALAAVLVVIHHAGYDADTIAARTGHSPLALDRFVDGTFGIHLFFVLSGFLMVRTAGGFGSPRGAALFMARRILRVVPLYWLMSLLVLAGAALWPQLLNVPVGDAGVVASSFLFIPVLRSGELRPVLGQGWTLDYEMFFYVLFAATMLLPRRVALAALAASLVALVALGHLLQPVNPVLRVWTDGLLLEFLFGLVLGLAEDVGTRLPVAAATLCALAGAIAAVALGPVFPRLGGLDPLVRGGVPAGMIVAACALGPRWSAGRLTLALAMLGDASYSLYLSHPFVVRVLRAVALPTVGRHLPPVVFLLLATASAVAAALVLHRTIERPLTVVLQRRSGLGGATNRPVATDSSAGRQARES